MAASLLHLWPHAPPPLLLLGVGAVGAVFVIVACLLRPSLKERAHARAPLPFDVEGGGTAAVLPQAVVDAASSGDVGMLRAWIGDPRCVIDACSAADGSTALHAACKAGHVNVVRLLLEASADVLAVDADLRTPLHLVAAAGHGICVKLTLSPLAADKFTACCLQVRRRSSMLVVTLKGTTAKGILLCSLQSARDIWAAYV
eukprot:6185067-Pleurochrysis_carterae.AAC.1